MKRKTKRRLEAEANFLFKFNLLEKELHTATTQLHDAMLSINTVKTKMTHLVGMYGRREGWSDPT